MLNKNAILFLAVGFALVFQTHSQICIDRQDVVLVYEVANNAPNQFETVKEAFQQLAWLLKPENHDCTRLGIVLAWKQADVLVELNCTYGVAQCYKGALEKIEGLSKQEKSSGKQVAMYKKETLVSAIQTANQMLEPGSPGTRFGVGKSVILVLNNGPAYDNLPTEDAVKQIHDDGITLYVLAVAEGKKEHLDHIAIDDRHVYRTDDKDSATRALKLISNLITGSFKMLGESVSFEAPLQIAKIEADDQFEALSVLLADSKSNLCREKVDIGFVMDSSRSIKKYYSKEKFFVQRVAAVVGLEKGSRAGVVLFSSGDYVKMVIPFDKQYTLTKFRQEVEGLPLYGYQTRIDKALNVAGRDLFSEKNGDQPKVKDILILITDGKQTPPAGDYDGKTEIVAEPGEVARGLRNRNISIYAVGVGGGVNRTQLERITGDPNKVFMLKRFSELITDEFVRNLTQYACKAAEIKTATPAVVTFTNATSTVPATTQAAVTTTEAKKDCKCKDCKSCGCGGDCGCKRGCEKPAIYLNVFNGANSNNVVVQGSKVSQTAQRSSLIDFGQGNVHPKLMAGGSFKNKTVDEIKQLLKIWLPYQNKANEAVAELLRRSMQKRRKRSL